MEEGISCWGLHSSEYSGEASLREYDFLYKKIHDKPNGFPISIWRTWELTNLKGVNENGSLKKWKITELKWKEKFFNDRGIKWQLCLGEFKQNPKLFFDKRLDNAMFELLSYIKPTTLEIANEIQNLIKYKWCQFSKYPEKEVIRRHNELILKAKHQIQGIQTVVSPYYFGHLPCQMDFYKKFEGDIYGRHIYGDFIDRGYTLPVDVQRVDETSYSLWKSNKERFPEVKEVLYWFDKNHYLPNVEWENYN